MNRKDRNDFKKLVAFVLQWCPGTSCRQAEEIARRKMIGQDGDSIDDYFVD